MGKNRRLKQGIISVAAVLVVMSLLILNTNTALSEEAKPAKTVYIADLDILSGPYASTGLAIKEVMDLALEDINGAGGITVGGQQYLLGVKRYDTAYKIDAAISCYKRAKGEGIKVMFVAGLGTSLALLKLNEADGVVIYSASPSEKATLTGNKLTVAMLPRPDTGVEALAKYATGLGKKKVFGLVDVKAVGKTQWDLFRTKWEKFGGEAIDVEFVDPSEVSDFHPILTKIKGANPDFIYLVFHGEVAGQIAIQAKEVGFEASALMFSPICTGAEKTAGWEVLEDSLWVGSATMGAYLAPLVPNASRGAIAIYNKYLKKYGKSYYSSAQPCGYYAVQHAARAMEVAGTITDAHAIRSAATEAAMQLAKEGKAAMPYTGYTRGGQPYGCSVFALQVKNGKYEFVAEIPVTEEMAAAGEP